MCLRFQLLFVWHLMLVIVSCKLSLILSSWIYVYSVLQVRDRVCLNSIHLKHCLQFNLLEEFLCRLKWYLPMSPDSFKKFIRLMHLSSIRFVWSIERILPVQFILLLSSSFSASVQHFLPLVLYANGERRVRMPLRSWILSNKHCSLDLRVFFEFSKLSNKHSSTQWWQF